MKKRLLAVLMAISLVLGTCTLFASAAIDVGKYLKGDASALKIATEGTDFNKSLSITAKTDATLPLGTTSLTADHIDEVFTFKSGSSAVKYKGNLDKYITITATVDDSGKVKITDATQKETIAIYEVSAKIEADAPINYDDYKESLNKSDKPIYKDGDVLALVGAENTVKFVAKLCSLTTGVRFFGSTYNNLVASEIAQVEATYKRNGKQVKSVTNEIKDLMTGEEVTLKASLKDIDKDGDEVNDNAGFYAFYCWVDGNGTVLETSDTIKWTAGSSSGAIYATFVETVDRVRIDYSATNCSIVYAENTKSVEGRDVFEGAGQISVMSGRAATFTFIPDEGYELISVTIDGVKNSTRLLNIVNSADVEELKNNLKDYISANRLGIEGKTENKKSTIYSYTFTAEQLAAGNGDHSIEVYCTKIETPSGKDLPTVAPEGITLATGLAGEEAEGGDAEATTVPAEKNNGSNGSNGGSSDGIVNPQTGSASAVAVFAVLSVAAGAAFVTSKKKD